jgi:predicted GTPase
MTEQPFSYLPEPARTLVRRAYRQVPADLRGELQTWLPYALNDAGSAFDLLGFITDNYVAAFSQTRMKIAIVGPANTGKSTLYNEFLPEGATLALVTPEPGDTVDAQESEGRLFTLVDTPAADAKRRKGRRHSMPRAPPTSSSSSSMQRRASLPPTGGSSMISRRWANPTWSC